MKKLILQEFVTLDGFAAGAGGDLGFMPGNDNKIGVDHELDKDMLQFMDTIDTILIGRVTYEMFVEYWPPATTEKEMVADKLNGIPKIVFSNSLKEAPWGKWPAARVVGGNAADEVRKLKQQPGRDMVLWGSISLAQSLMKDRLIDEYYFFICPSLLGDGKPLFTRDAPPSSLKLVESKTYKTGVVLMKYRLGE